MSDARYDAVVLGGGHHATIIAPYLARAGLSVLVLERTAHLGGGACASEGPAPGFVMNHCSHWTRFYGHPAYRDFGLLRRRAAVRVPRGERGDDLRRRLVVRRLLRLARRRRDHRPPGALGPEHRADPRSRSPGSRGPTPTRTSRLLDAYEQHWKQAFRRHRFSTPPPWGTPDPLEELLDVPGSRIEPVHQFMTLRQLAQDFFESPELQILFMRAATTSTGCFPDDVPGLQGLIHCLPLTLSFEPAAIAVGGSQAITDALVSAGRKLGVEYVTSSEVDRIIVEHGRATGVELAGGAQIAADLVVSDLGLAQTVLRLLRDDRAPGPAAPPDRQHPLRPRPAPVGQPRAPRAAPLPRRGATTRASARSRGCTGDRRTSTTCTSATSPRSSSTASRRARTCCARSTACGTRPARRTVSTSSASRSSRRRGARSPTASGATIKHRFAEQRAARMGALRAEHDRG